MVVRERADMTALNQRSVEYLIKKKPEVFSGKVDFVDKVLGYNPLHLIVSKEHRDAPLIIETFNRGLKKIRQNGVYQKLLQKYDRILAQ